MQGHVERGPKREWERERGKDRESEMEIERCLDFRVLKV